MCNRPRQQQDEMPLLSRFVKIIIFLICVSAIYLVVSFKPLTKEEQIESYQNINKYVEPFRRNLSECARQVKASAVDVQNFLKRIPQSTMQGKCLVACVLKRNAIITKNRINQKNLFESNKAVYGEDSEVLVRLKKAMKECEEVVDNIFEICEYASIFNDCMHMKMEHTLDKETMERRMEALGQVSKDSDFWSDDEEELLRLAKDEL